MKKRFAIATLLICALVAAVVLVLGRSSDRLHSKARRDWKASATPEIARRARDTNWLSNEAKQIRTEIAKEPDSGDWISPHLMLTKNDEWMVYANKCSKEDPRIHDIFVGRASNGKWYYSTYHFCVRMVAARMDEQPESLVVLTKRYFLVEFDGNSDECLRRTWPPKRE